MVDIIHRFIGPFEWDCFLFKHVKNIWEYNSETMMMYDDVDWDMLGSWSKGDDDHSSNKMVATISALSTMM